MTTLNDAFPPLVLRSGPGESYADGFCLMQAVGWLAGGEGHTDAPECACPVLAAYAIRINDAFGDADRQKLRRLIVPLIGTRSIAHERARAKYIVRRTAHEIVAPLFDSRWPQHAEAIRAAVSMWEIRQACRAAANAANAAANAANAAANAANAAANAANAAYAGVLAAANAANAAYAGVLAAANAAAHAHADPVLLISILDGAIRLGPNGGDALAPFTARIEALRTVAQFETTGE